MKIKALDKMTEKGIDYVINSETIGFTSVDREAEILYIHFKDVDIRDYPRAKYIVCPCTNVNHITADLPIIYLDNKEYLFKNVWSTAEHTVYMMVALTKRYRRQLFNSTVGFVGYGRVANQVENLLYGFNITSYTFDKPDNKKVLHELFRVCDIITVHIEENKATKGLIDANCFEKCTKQPIFINTSRASIVKPEALIKAYKNGKIRGFGLDVTEGYSQEEIGELMQKGFVTPHIAGKSLPSRELTDLYVLGELERRVLKEEELLSVN